MRETLMCEKYVDGLPLAHPQLGTWPATQPNALTGNQTGDPLVLRLALNPPHHTSQGYRDFYLDSSLLLTLTFAPFD